MHCISERQVTSASNSSSDILALCGLISWPFWEKTRSTGAELAGEHSTSWNNWCNCTGIFAVAPVPYEPSCRLFKGHCL